jgi:hypothetical protein
MKKKNTLREDYVTYFPVTTYWVFDMTPTAEETAGQTALKLTWAICVCIHMWRGCSMNTNVCKEAHVGVDFLLGGLYIVWIWAMFCGVQYYRQRLESVPSVCIPCWGWATWNSSSLEDDVTGAPIYGARGSVVVWGTMLQAGRPPILITDEVDFFSLPNPSNRTMALGSSQPVTNMSTRTLLVG